MTISHLDQHVRVEIKIGSTWTNFNDGTLSIDILRGITNAYEGPHQQVESGVLTLVSRNLNLDPYTNSNIRRNKYIRVVETDDGEPIFTGRINSINVDYQPKGKPAIVTITAVDMVGTMALYTVPDTFKTGKWSLDQVFQDFHLYSSTANPLIPDFVYGNAPQYAVAEDYNAGSAITYSTNPITALSMATTQAQSCLQFFWADKYNKIWLRPNIRYNKDAVPKLQFDSRGGATSYSSIILTDGFDLLKNQVSTTDSTGNSPQIQNTYSTNEWGPAKLTVNTFGDGVSNTTRDISTFASGVLKQTAYPTREIQSITFDSTRSPDNAHSIDILDNIYIYHEVEGFSINKKYGIIGIHHQITQDSWDITYKLKNMFTYEELYKTPVIAVNTTSGTTNTVFSFSISNLSELFTTGATYSWSFGDTQTSTLQSPTHQYSIGYVGTRTVTLTFTNSYGFVFTSTIQVLVAGAAPTNVSFTYTVSPTDTSLINFVGSIATNASSYLWDFGDGQTSQQREVSHKYTTSGNKTVIYKAINAYGQTTSTQTINVTVPATPTNQVGTWPVKWIRIGTDAYTAPSGYVLPLMKDFKATTSYTNTNRGSAVTVRHSQNYKLSTSEIRGGQIWKMSNGNEADVFNNTSCNSNLLQVGASGLQPYMNYSGTTNWSLILKLSDVFYDIKEFDMTFDTYVHPYAPEVYTNYPTYIDYRKIYIWITDYTGTTVPVDDVTWTYAGYIEVYSGTWHPAITMPPNLP